MMKQLLISGAALAAVLAISAPAQATTTYFSGSTTAQAPSGLTPVVAFTAPGAAHVDVTVTDCCIVGDNYATFVDGNYIGSTPSVPLNGPTLSSATFAAILGAGPNHDFQLADLYLGILPAGVNVTIAAPEPASWALMMVGMFGLGGALRARKSIKSQVA